MKTKKLKDFLVVKCSGTFSFKEQPLWQEKLINAFKLS